MCRAVPVDANAVLSSPGPAEPLAFALRGSTPHAVVLAGDQRELQAGRSDRAAGAHGPGLPQGLCRGLRVAVREEQRWTDAGARRRVPPAALPPLVVGMEWLMSPGDTRGEINGWFGYAAAGHIGGTTRR